MSILFAKNSALHVNALLCDFKVHIILLRFIAINYNLLK